MSDISGSGPRLDQMSQSDVGQITEFVGEKLKQVGGSRANQDGKTCLNN